jgi:ferric-dicitrate binding protein FerR (iron transport regulator)
VAVLALGGGALATYVSKGPAPPTGPPVAAETTSWRVYTNASAYETRVALPDGSAVRLAPASTLKYRRTADGTRRVAYLTGAGSFAIFHDAQHPFSVYTDQVVSTVLGTSFRVRAYAGQPEVQVQVLTGAVRVSPREPSATGVVVRPNQQAVYSPARRQLRRELVAKPALLVPQSFVFDDRPVAEVLASLEKAYGVDIVYDAAALRSCTINLTLHDEPLFAKLDLLCETLGSTYEQTDGRIVFHAQPCPAD